MERRGRRRGRREEKRRGQGKRRFGEEGMRGWEGEV